MATDYGSAISGEAKATIIQVYQAAPGRGRLDDQDVERYQGEYLRWVRGM